MSSIKVALRARPWTLDDRLGIDMQQVDADSGTITLINSDYSTKFFSFSYSWWTAFNYKHHCDAKDMDVADGMKIVSQDDVYASVGQKIKADLYEGNAVVLFAYGLSGSGKTFTVFGMDDVKNKNSWFYHETPDKNWGVLPRLGYDVFQDRKDGWKVTMKYFQNVVDIVRDLMSPAGTEKIYKEGMRKDADGFMDIEWCQSAVLNSWADLRKTFLAANARKAIAPTQFNHQSTRGHCIMTIEVLMPDESDSSMKKRGRVYVCDLAGTEPAGDIYFANYNTVEMPDGTMEVKLIGPHQDQKRTAELQNQGKKINLSLSEMAQFFMKMAEAFKAKKLKPGVSIPGCNTYFLCKYLKDTMLNAKTYLFCAIRPEVTYLKYTFATLGFAKNASVVQLAPKKATTNASPAERKLMAELEKYKLMVEEMKKGGGGGGSDEVGKLQAMLAAQQEALQKVVNEDGGEAEVAIKEEQEKKRKQYAQRGITLAEMTAFADITAPYLINLDEDEFRTRRYLYILKDGETTFGPGGEMRPPSFSVKKNHCKLTVGAGHATTITCGDGVTWAGKKRLAAGETVSLSSGDWLLMGSEIMQFFMPGAAQSPEEYSGEDIFGEIFECQQAAPASGAAAGGGDGGGGDPELAKRIAELEAQNTQLQASNAGADGAPAGGAGGAPTSFDEAEVMTVINLIREVAELCKLMDRGDLKFEPVLARQDTGGGGQGRTFIKVTHSTTKQTALVSDADFHLKCSVLNDEKLSLSMAFDSNDEYTTPDDHDPMALFFNDMYHIASGRHFCEYLAYNFETEHEDKDVNLVASASPYHNSGILNIDWRPAADAPEISDISELLGKPWKFTLSIKNAAIKIRASQCYVSYSFPDESGGTTKYTTDVANQETMTPTFDYEFTHEISCVTQHFIDFVAGKNGMDFDIYASPVYKLPSNKISTSNPALAAAFNATVVMGGTDLEIANLRKDKDLLQSQLEAAIGEIAKATGEEVSKVRSRLIEAKLADANANSAPTPE